MFYIRVAELVIGIECQYDYTRQLCRSYLTEERNTHFVVRMTDAQIQRERTAQNFPVAYLESLAVYREIAERVIAYHGFLMHGVALEADGCGVLLTAPSGVGKTTHALYWKQLLGERCHIINGDKPLIRMIDGKSFAYGTPWCGKEGLHQNSKVSLTDMLVISRSEENKVCDISYKEALLCVLAAVYRPAKPEQYQKTLETIDEFLKIVQVRSLTCDKSLRAAQVAWEAVRK